MERIEFYDRDKELKEIKNILKRDPSLITFIYGPINSGKTELISYLMKQLSGEYVAFYINLRAKFLSSHEEFIEALFELDLEETKRKETLKELVSSITKVAGIPITEKFIDYVFKDKKPKNAFSYMIKLFEEVKSMGKQPVLIVDELQKIGDVKIEGMLIYELFNFFIDLTKELHLCHVFAVTSDSLFIERVYNEAMLQGRRRYVLVDDFDYKTAMEFLDKEGFSEVEKEKAWKYMGGKPVYLVELVNSEERVEKMEEMLTLRTGEIETMLKIVNELGDEIAIGDKNYSVSYERLVDSLKKFADVEEIGINEIDEVSKRYLVKKNILFVEPLRKKIRPQSRLDLLSLREAVKEA